MTSGMNILIIAAVTAGAIAISVLVWLIFGVRPLVRRIVKAATYDNWNDSLHQYVRKALFPDLDETAKRNPEWYCRQFTKAVSRHPWIWAIFFARSKEL